MCPYSFRSTVKYYLSGGYYRIYPIYFYSFTDLTFLNGVINYLPILCEWKPENLEQCKGTSSKTLVGNIVPPMSSGKLK
uniref:Uncharacterized protein n=1 Tax=Pararge aegeria TaxID=116150 RepID=S4P5I3_9NEOP